MYEREMLTGNKDFAEFARLYHRVHGKPIVVDENGKGLFGSLWKHTKKAIKRVAGTIVSNPGAAIAAVADLAKNRTIRNAIHGDPFKDLTETAADHHNASVDKVADSFRGLLGDQVTPEQAEGFFGDLWHGVKHVASKVFDIASDPEKLSQMVNTIGTVVQGVSKVAPAVA